MSDYRKYLSSHRLAKLRTTGIALPQPILDAEAKLHAHTKRAPTSPPNISHLTQAWINGATDTEINKIATRMALARDIAASHREAHTALLARLDHALLANSDDIIDQLNPKAEKHIEALNQAAALPTLDTTELIRAGNTTGAKIAAQADTHAAHLLELWDLAHGITGGNVPIWGQEFGFNCREYMNPHKVVSITKDMTTTERIITAINDGAEPWFPLPTEAQAQAAAHKKAHDDAQPPARARIRPMFTGPAL
ncbi:hypothetical protein HT102_03380 [Hoyosella sp. G463]|uniref:Uncharacterized protein n=1 Tax=Lolliginicoccus lacisalsi TaxID=2742202 RepID=A0A927PKB6_9ACTN|nr:hypothetical protein [Lolliginicoccus lacisalsi]MBD8505533.1 hypothetical protein [Lolliginicoccus lacisalsi]